MSNASPRPGLLKQNLPFNQIPRYCVGTQELRGLWWPEKPQSQGQPSFTRTSALRSASSWCCRGPCLRCARQRRSSTCQSTDTGCLHPRWWSHSPSPPGPGLFSVGRYSTHLHAAKKITVEGNHSKNKLRLLTYKSQKRTRWPVTSNERCGIMWKQPWPQNHSPPHSLFTATTGTDAIRPPKAKNHLVKETRIWKTNPKGTASLFLTPGGEVWSEAKEIYIKIGKNS